MTLTHAQLMDAIRAAGHDQRSFTCADVRQHLGLATQDKKQLNRFYSRFRALQKDAANQIEKLGSNCYQLRSSALAQPISTQRSEAEWENDDTSVLTCDDLVEVVAMDVDVARTAQTLELPPPPPAHVINCVDLDDTNDTSSEPAAEPSAPAIALPVAKVRSEWFSKMARFFGRRTSQGSGAQDAAVGV